MKLFKITCRIPKIVRSSFLIALLSLSSILLVGAYSPEGLSSTAFYSGTEVNKMGVKESLAIINSFDQLKDLEDYVAQLTIDEIEKLEPEDLELLSLLEDIEPDYMDELSHLDAQELQAKALENKKLAVFLDKVDGEYSNAKVLGFIFRVDRMFGRLLFMLPAVLRAVVTGIQRGVINGATSRDATAISEAVSSGFTYGCNSVMPLGSGSIGGVCSKLGDLLGELVETVIDY